MGAGAGETPWGSIASGTLGAGMGIVSAITNAGKQRSAERELANLKSPELTNVANNLQVSTLGSDLRTRESARNTATSVDALQGGGARALIGGLGAIQSRNNLVAEENASNLDAQQKDIDRMKAEEERRIQGVEESRYQNDVSALSSQINSANEAKQQGLANALQGASTVGNAFDYKYTPDYDSNKYKDYFGNPMRFPTSVRK